MRSHKNFKANLFQIFFYDRLILYSQSKKCKTRNMNEEEIEYQNLINKIRLQVADVIINYNLLELEIKEIIGLYINSDKTEFIFKVLLNNLVVSFSAKVNLLKYIIKKENIVVDSKFQNSLKVIMTKRNILAHSDEILKLEPNIVDIDVDWNHDECFIYPIYKGASESFIHTLDDGQINYQFISKIVEDFIKYYSLAKEELIKVRNHICKLSNNSFGNSLNEDELPF